MKKLICFASLLCILTNALGMQNNDRTSASNNTLKHIVPSKESSTPGQSISVKKPKITLKKIGISLLAAAGAIGAAKMFKGNSPLKDSLKFPEEQQCPVMSVWGDSEFTGDLTCNANLKELNTVLQRYDLSLNDCLKQSKVKPEYLYHAVSTDPNAVEFLVDYCGADVNRVRYSNVPLIQAIQKQNEPLVKYLLKHGAIVNFGTHMRTPLDYAMELKNGNIAMYLVEHGALIMDKNLYTAAERGNISLVKYLIKSVGSVDPGEHWCSGVEHYIYIINGNLSLVKSFAKCFRGFKPGEQWIYGSLLHGAAIKGHMHLAEYLVEHGANVNLTDFYGDTPLHVAAREGHMPLAEYLVEHGADVNIKNERGETPLDEALERKDKKIVKFFVEHGADVNLTDFYGDTPLGIFLNTIIKKLSKSA